MSNVLTGFDYHTEFIDGQEVPKPLPKNLHAFIQGFLIRWFGRELPGQYYNLPELNVLCGPDPLVPEITVVAKGARYSNGDLAEAAPLVVEFFSPGQSIGDLFGKADRFLQAGTRYCWIIWPEKRKAWTYTATDMDDSAYLYASLPNGSVDDFEIRLLVADLWSVLDEIASQA